MLYIVDFCPEIDLACYIFVTDFLVRISCPVHLLVLYCFTKYSITVISPDLLLELL